MISVGSVISLAPSQAVLNCSGTGNSLWKKAIRARLFKPRLCKLMDGWLESCSVTQVCLTLCPMDGGAWWTSVHGVSKSQTGLSGMTFTFHFSLSCTGEGNGNPLQCSCLENPRDSGAWWAAVYGITQSWTQLKWLSSSSGRGSFLYLQFLSYYGVVGLFNFSINFYESDYAVDLKDFKQTSNLTLK